MPRTRASRRAGVGTLTLLAMLLAESYVHDLSPVLIDLPGAFAIRYYGLSYLVGFIIAYVLLRALAKRNIILLPGQHVLDLIFYCVVGVLVGGRLGYVFFYDLMRSLNAGETPLLWSIGGSFPFWGVFRINDGGMASHGGILGVMFAGFVFARRYDLTWRHVMDCVALACPLGLGIGRVANFINAELWGKSLPADMRNDPPAWSVKYPAEITEHWSRLLRLDAIVSSEPDNAAAADALRDLTYRMAADFQVVDRAGMSFDALRDTVLREASARLAELQPLQSYFPNSEALYHDIAAAGTRGTSAIVEHITPLLTPYYPSQLVQALAEGPVLFGALALTWLTPKKQGTIGAMFLLVYGVLRVLTETVRQADEGVASIAGLQRGQLLSVAMILGALIALLYLRSKNDVPKVGGLLTKTKS